MKRLKLSLSVLIAILAACLWGCAAGVAPDGERVETNDQALGEEFASVSRLVGGVSRLEHGIAVGLISQNALPSGMLANPGLVAGLVRLSTMKLDEHGLAATGLIDTEQGLKLVEYVVRCALQRGDVIAAGGETFSGNVGLAPSWKNAPLSSAADRRWISACLLAHTNNFATGVDIALSGNHPALRGGDGSSHGADVWEFEEAAFYGDLFIEPTGSQNTPTTMFACSGLGAPNQCEYSVVAKDLHERVCGSSETCGFAHTGPCRDYQSVAARPLEACNGDVRALYSKCGASRVPRGSDIAAPYHEVITVYLRTSDVQRLHPECRMQCSHLVCQTGEALSSNCDPNVERICRSDPFCCQNRWDGRCVAEATSIAGLTCRACSHNVCTEGARLTASCDASTAAICAEDSYCCNNAWDSLCTARARARGFCRCFTCPPRVSIVRPAASAPAPTNPAYVFDGFDSARGMFYKDLVLEGSAVDGEDGTLPDTALVWKTNRTELQPEVLGRGRSVTVRLFSRECTGTPHVIRLEASDRDGNRASATRTIVIWTLC